jgi:hypothetical protein
MPAPFGFPSPVPVNGSFFAIAASVGPSESLKGVRLTAITDFC